MPTDLVKRVNLDLLYPPFVERLLNLLAKARESGQDYYVISGFRSHKQQQALFELGRSKPGRKVTNAPAGLSAHNWGMAVDVVADESNKPGLQPTWTLAKYTLLKKLGPTFDLQVGVPGIQDDGHIQLPLRLKTKRREAEVFRECNLLFQKDGMAAVWRKFDEWQL